MNKKRLSEEQTVRIWQEAETMTIETIPLRHIEKMPSDLHKGIE